MKLSRVIVTQSLRADRRMWWKLLTAVAAAHHDEWGLEWLTGDPQRPLDAVRTTLGAGIRRELMMTPLADPVVVLDGLALDTVVLLVVHHAYEP